MHLAARALCFIAANTGKRIAAKMRMIAMTTISSMRVNPCLLLIMLSPPHNNYTDAADARSSENCLRPGKLESSPNVYNGFGPRKDTLSRKILPVSHPIERIGQLLYAQSSTYTLFCQGGLPVYLTAH